MPDIERTREVALLLGVADPQGAVAGGVPPIIAYGAEAYSIASLEQKRPITASDLMFVFHFWNMPYPAWHNGTGREMRTLLATLESTRPRF